MRQAGSITQNRHFVTFTLPGSPARGRINSVPTRTSLLFEGGKISGEITVVSGASERGPEDANGKLHPDESERCRECKANGNPMPEAPN